MKDNKQVLEKANGLIAKGDYEGFLSYCTNDTIWNFIGDRILIGKEAVRNYIAETYTEPPNFRVDNLLAEQDFVIAIGQISLKDKDGEYLNYAYCDIWRLKDGKLHELKAFVVQEPQK